MDSPLKFVIKIKGKMINFRIKIFGRCPYNAFGQSQWYYLRTLIADNAMRSVYLIKHPISEYVSFQFQKSIIQTAAHAITSI